MIKVKVSSIESNHLVIIRNSKIIKNGYDGVFLDDQSYSLITKSLISKNNYNGISIKSSFQAILLENDISENSWDGLSIATRDVKLVLSKNNFDSNYGVGIYFLKGKGDYLYLDYNIFEDLENSQKNTNTSETQITEKNNFNQNKKGKCLI